MAAKKVITVFGATGAQGGAVAQTFLHDPKLSSDWLVRAVTRDASRESAKKLAGEGAEVVTADLDDGPALEKAMAGASAVFAVTNYWDKMDMQLEIQQGKRLVDAAEKTGVAHFIWSSLLNVNGKLPNVYHFDSKAKVEEYARQTGLPATFFLAGYYMSNLPGHQLQKNRDTDAWTFALPIPETAQIPMFEVADTGKFVKAILAHRDRLLGKRVLGATAYMTGKEIVDEFKRAFPEAGRTAVYFSMPHDEYLGLLKSTGLPDHGALELLENMRLMEEYGYYGGAALDETHAILEDKLGTWEEHLKKSAALQGLH